MEHLSESWGKHLMARIKNGSYAYTSFLVWNYILALEILTDTIYLSKFFIKNIYLFVCVGS